MYAAAQPNGAGHRWQISGYGAQQGGFTGPIWAGDDNALTIWHLLGHGR